ncbi:hypothetical protein ABEG18_14635 [Alsobacter sp. KACC 23698]|uniref:Uncharacterized protein n=1 Tax=Alsobacter sp. KACC 23698 TaxID=3149229 RepID=A0AAU7J9D1_9HYPH
MLKPYVKRVEERIEKNQDKIIWSAVEARWLANVENAKRIWGDFYAGKAGSGWEREAAASVLKLADNVQPMTVVKTVLALYLLERDNPHFFQDDRALRFQITRRVRGLTKLNAGSYWDAKANGNRLVYKDLHPKAAEFFAQWIVQTLGPVGVHLQHLEDREVEIKRRAEADFREALSELA